MGSYWSRETTQSNEADNSTELQDLSPSTNEPPSQSELQPSGVYFGPRFITDFSQYPFADSPLLRNELHRMLWDEIWSVLTQGVTIEESQLAQFGNAYQQV